MELPLSGRGEITFKIGPSKIKGRVAIHTVLDVQTANP